MSTNQSYSIGVVKRRAVIFKSKRYKNYEKALLWTLKKRTAPEKVILVIEWGIEAGTDIDNPAKPFIDILQKKYGFNDNRVYMLLMHKVKVKRGDGFIRFKVMEYKKGHDLIKIFT